MNLVLRHVGCALGLLLFILAADAVVWVMVGLRRRRPCDDAR